MTPACGPYGENRGWSLDMSYEKQIFINIKKTNSYILPQKATSSRKINTLNGYTIICLYCSFDVQKKRA